MAEGKKSFVLYSDIIHMVRKMPVEKQGELFMLILSFVNDENPQTDDLLLQIAFEPIKVNLKRDLKQWEVFSKNKSESGFIGNIKRWHEDVYNDFVNEKITIDEAKEIVKNRKSSVSDKTDSSQSKPIAEIASNVSVSANVNANVNVTNPINNIKDRKLKFADSISVFLDEYGKDLLNNFYEYWTEHGVNDKKMRFEKQKSFDISLRLKRWLKNSEIFKEKSSAKKESTEPKVGRMTQSDAQQSLMNAIGVKIPGT